MVISSVMSPLLCGLYLIIVDRGDNPTGAPRRSFSAARCAERAEDAHAGHGVVMPWGTWSGQLGFNQQKSDFNKKVM